MTKEEALKKVKIVFSAKEKEFPYFQVTRITDAGDYGIVCVCDYHGEPVPMPPLKVVYETGEVTGFPLNEGDNQSIMDSGVELYHDLIPYSPRYRKICGELWGDSIF